MTPPAPLQGHLFQIVLDQVIPDGRLQPPPPAVTSRATVAGHDPDCDGFVMHTVAAQRTTFGTYVPACPVCGPLPVVGSAGSPETAVALGAGHAASVPCDGGCLR